METYEAIGTIAHGNYIKGKLEGELKGKLEVARELLYDGTSLEKIKKLTGLTDEQMDALIAKSSDRQRSV